MYRRYVAPDTLTEAEQQRLLAVTAAAPRPRDHILFSMALGTGLRLSELLALNVGDITPDGVAIHTRVRLTGKGGRRADVFLPDRLREKLASYLDWKRAWDEPVAADAPLFLSQRCRRLSARRVQMAFAEWQRRAGFDRHYGFHCARHSAITAVYRATRDLFLAQRFARHASPLTTVVPTIPTRSCLTRSPTSGSRGGIPQSACR